LNCTKFAIAFVAHLRAFLPVKSKQAYW